ncbi:hypothetical protein [Sphingomonas japonica]|nr:hypothetical protein [Sphingomonas japonica]
MLRWFDRDHFILTKMCGNGNVIATTPAIAIFLTKSGGACKFAGMKPG